MSSRKRIEFDDQRRSCGILIVIEHYSPGYKYGGPIRSIVGLIDRLGDEFSFHVITSDRDFKEKNPYPRLEAGAWRNVGKAAVLYLIPREMRLRRWRRLLNRLEYKVIYLNGYFTKTTIRTLILRFLKMIPSKPVILAPRGEFSSGALGLKRMKKTIYMQVARWMRMYHHIIWQASSENEKRDILRALGLPEDEIMVAPNMVPASVVPRDDRRVKKSGSLRMVFLSRISRMKNLDYALNISMTLRGDIFFDIYGIIEDRDYWKECQAIMKNIPGNVFVSYRGEATPDQVPDILSGYHLFILPTRGENYGHVIHEALRAGCPVLISDRTQWNGLEEKKAGWDIPLSRPERFIEMIEAMTEMNEAAYHEWSTGARRWGETMANPIPAVEQNRLLLTTACQAGLRER